MSEASSTPRDLARKIAGRIGPSREGNFPRNLFGDVARVIWPTKTAFELAAIAHTTDRAAKDWLSGKAAVPGAVLAAIMVKLAERPPR